MNLDKDIINKIMKNSLTDDCLEFLDILNKNGFESFAVGGCVRDCLLGNIPKDEDLTTNATPEQVREVFSKLKGFSVWDSGLKHGTVTVVKGNTSIEITTYRSDGDYSDGRRPDSVKFEDSIDKDLARRDFTINALAWSPRDGFKDNYNGLDDLQNGFIKAVGNANDRISEDALRMMRAIRFSARYGFDIEDSLVEAIKNNTSNLSNISKERIRDELCKTLMTDNPTYVKRFRDLGLMKEISPEINMLFDCEQNCVYHNDSVGEHSIHALENTPKDLNLRVAALLHDIGKPVVKTTDENGQDHFYNHAEVSEIISINVLRDLKFSSEEVKNISRLVKFHDFLLDLPSDNKTKLYQKSRDFIINNPEIDDNFYGNLMIIQKCDALAQNLDNSKIHDKLRKIEILNETFSKILEGPHRTKDLTINGNDIMTFQREDRSGNMYFCKGPVIKEMQKILLREVIDNPDNNTKDVLMEIGQRQVIQANNNVEVSRNKKLDEENHKLETIDKVNEYEKSLEESLKKENKKNSFVDLEP